MARTKKTIAKKATKKTTAKRGRKTAAKAASAKASSSKAKKPKAKAANARTIELKPIIRRPAQNLPPTPELIDIITTDILTIAEDLKDYTANLRSLDRMRHNGVGLKRLGFIQAAYRISTNYPQYFPHWLDTAKFRADLNLFNSIRSLVEACRSLEEKAWNINVESSDMTYTDALEYYSQVQDAANRRIDAAESLYVELHSFFRQMGRRHEENGEAPTVKKTKRDANALMKGTKDGEVIIKNVRPKLTGGKREIIDETFRDSASFKDSIEGDLIE